MTTKYFKVFKDGKNTGYIFHNQNWWFDSSFKDSFSIFDLDGFYSEEYFTEDHVKKETISNYCTSVLDYLSKVITASTPKILELGGANGFFTEEFIKRGVDITSVEGTTAGIAKCLARGIPTERLVKHDLRLPLNLNQRFDLVICTEVAEHLEPPFSSQLISNIVNHGDLVWFSSEPPFTNEPNYHHCNEQPDKFWENLFAFYGYSYLKIPESLKSVLEDRGTHIFYREEVLGDKINKLRHYFNSLNRQEDELRAEQPKIKQLLYKAKLGIKKTPFYKLYQIVRYGV